MAVSEKVDILIIGAGPSGAIAAALLVNKGYSVRVLEKQTFPRFSIGESLLPHCMQFIEEAGMLAAVHAGGFQYKNGAAFHFNGINTDFDFREKFSPGWGTTYQVDRASFDKILADEAQRMGADIRYQHEITDVDLSGEKPSVSYKDAQGNEQTQQAEFILDASGFGRVLPRLLDLNTPSNFPVRQSIFTHVIDNIDRVEFDREKILITVHPENRDVWFWLIPFGNGRASIGVVAEQSFFENFEGEPEQKLKKLISDDANLSSLLANAQFDFPVQMITGYSANVKSLHGKGYALLGNAGEFLDPVFSSGVTIAMKSAQFAVECVEKQLNGEKVDWDRDYADPLMVGVNTFRTYVEGWYSGTLQDVIFYQDPNPKIKQMVCSILAGYAWDQTNPYVKESKRRLTTLAEICRS